MNLFLRCQFVGSVSDVKGEVMANSLLYSQKFCVLQLEELGSRR